MKHIIHIIVLAVITVVYISCEKEDYALQRLSAPAQLTASRGDTSVFLKWTKVEDASFYTKWQNAPQSRITNSLQY